MEIRKYLEYFTRPFGKTTPLIPIPEMESDDEIARKIIVKQYMTRAELDKNFDDNWRHYKFWEPGIK